ncbi:hypothetical protein LOD99_3038 [Oopsacas minuta]|uniref:Uncharacterized protein n=1 Tax=Oopsacas minuta TaxID=111878 RepID=A0AAV7JYZ8_9METZ|nr:hypothetical protein LOD99_3038 [Oopsacas minuta]
MHSPDPVIPYQGVIPPHIPSKIRPKDIPIETKEEHNFPIYQTQEESLSPVKENGAKTHLNIKLNKLRNQQKTRSVDDETEISNATVESKRMIKRSTSDKFREQKLTASELFQSPVQQERDQFTLANQNAVFGLKPSYPVSTHGPVGNYGYDRKIRSHNISEESSESGFYTNSQHSTNSAHNNEIQSNGQLNCEIIDRPPSITFENEVPCMATGQGDRNLNELQLEQTIRPNLINPGYEPIYENFPPRSVSQSDSFLEDEVLRLRSLLKRIGKISEIEQIYKELKSQKNTILLLELKNEKLRRDNRILTNDSVQKEQLNQANILKVNQLIEQNRILQNYYQPSNPQSWKYVPNQPQPYLSPPVDVHRQYEPRNEVRTRQEPPPIESHRISYTDSDYYQPSTHRPNQSDYRIPRSLPNHRGITNYSDIPLNPHNNGSYPASHDPKGSR